MATDIAMKLMGKNKATYSPHADNGDYVVVINAKEVRVTGNKEDQKKYRKHSGYPGGFKEMSFKQMKEKNPGKIIEIAVKRMLPENRIRDDRMNRFFVFADESHPYKDKFK
jgi:large subunit ribosomal protein L13